MQTFNLSNIQKDPEDPRDFLYQVDYTIALPESVDLEPLMPLIDDQGRRGKCTGEAAIGIAEAFLLAAGKYVKLNADFSYDTGLYLLNGNKWPTQDTGCNMRMNLRAGAKLGIAPTSVWADDDSNAPAQPPQAVMDAAQAYKFGAYYRIPTTSPALWWSTGRLIYSIKHALARGLPVALSFQAGQAIFGLQGDQVYQPLGPNNPAAGGHEVVVIGYMQKDGNEVFKIRNSWGTGYGVNGYFYMSPNVITENVYDLWVATSFAGATAIGPDRTCQLPAPTDKSSIDDFLTYLYRAKFGRVADPSGKAWWANAIFNYFEGQILNAASPMDRQFMSDNNIL